MMRLRGAHYLRLVSAATLSNRQTWSHPRPTRVSPSNASDALRHILCFHRTTNRSRVLSYVQVKSEACRLPASRAVYKPFPFGLKQNLQVSLNFGSYCFQHPSICSVRAARFSGASALNGPPRSTREPSATAEIRSLNHVPRSMFQVLPFNGLASRRTPFRTAPSPIWHDLKMTYRATSQDATHGRLDPGRTTPLRGCPLRFW